MSDLAESERLEQANTRGIIRAKDRDKIKGIFLGRRKITFDKGPVTIVGDAYQDGDFITIITGKGHVRVALDQVILDDYASDDRGQ